MRLASLQGLSTQGEKRAAARSGLYALLAWAFAFPTRELVQAVSRGEIRAAIQALRGELPFDLTLDREGLTDPSLTYQQAQTEYIRLFEVGPGRVPCPLYEGLHRNGRMKLMEEIVRFYEHFGLQALPGDLPDHLCAELEFMHYLAFKEAVAIHRGTAERPYSLAQRDFLERHLCVWLPRLRARLEGCQPPPFYMALARLAEEFCARDLVALTGARGKSLT